MSAEPAEPSRDSTEPSSLFIAIFCRQQGVKTRRPPGAIQRSKLMKILLSAIALTLSVAFAAPAFAQTKEAPKTKADCTKAKDMKWDDKAGKCVKK